MFDVGAGGGEEDLYLYSQVPVERTVEEHEQGLVCDVGAGGGEVPARPVQDPAVLVNIQQGELFDSLQQLHHVTQDEYR